MIKKNGAGTPINNKYNDAKKKCRRSTTVQKLWKCHEAEATERSSFSPSHIEKLLSGLFYTIANHRILICDEW